MPVFDLLLGSLFVSMGVVVGCSLTTDTRFVVWDAGSTDPEEGRGTSSDVVGDSCFCISFVFWGLSHSTLPECVLLQKQNKLSFNIRLKREKVKNSNYEKLNTGSPSSSLISLRTNEEELLLEVIIYCRPKPISLLWIKIGY